MRLQKQVRPEISIDLCWHRLVEGASWPGKRRGGCASWRPPHASRRCARMVLARNAFLRKRAAVLRIQAAYRGHTARSVAADLR